MDRRNVFMEESIRPAEVVDVIPQTPKQSYSLRAQREATQMLERAYLDLGHIHCAAVLHRGVMQDAGSLAVAAGQLSQLAPQVSLAFWDVVNSYLDQSTKYLKERW